MAWSSILTKNYDAYSGPSHKVAIKALGHALPSGAQVHHVNGDHLDNRPSNLVICQDAAYHQILHRRASWLKTVRDILERDIT